MKVFTNNGHIFQQLIMRHRLVRNTHHIYFKFSYFILDLVCLGGNDYQEVICLFSFCKFSKISLNLDYKHQLLSPQLHFHLGICYFFFINHNYLFFQKAYFH